MISLFSYFASNLMRASPHVCTSFRRIRADLAFPVVPTAAPALPRPEASACDLTPPFLLPRTAGHHSYDDVRGLQGLLKICGAAMPAAATEEPVDVAALKAENAALKAGGAQSGDAALEVAALKRENAALKAQLAGEALRGEWSIDRNRLSQA